MEEEAGGGGAPDAAAAGALAPTAAAAEAGLEAAAGSPDEEPWCSAFGAIVTVDHLFDHEARRGEGGGVPFVYGSVGERRLDRQDSNTIPRNKIKSPQKKHHKNNPLKRKHKR